MNGIMLGLSPREARKRYEAVIEFAELQEFEDLKLKNYSSGMHVRLAFSVAIQVDADILLIDEVLAVGDAAFQQKCFDVFNEMRDGGKTIVFVTHDMGSMQRFCHRALLLERGSPVYLGEPSEVADRYLEINFGRDPERGRRRADDAAATARPRWSRCGSRTSAASALAAVQQGQRMTLSARVAFMVDGRGPGGERVRAQRGAQGDRGRHHRDSSTSAAAASRAGEEAVFSFTFENVLAPGRYSPVITLAHRGSGLDVIDRFEGDFSFVVTGVAPQGGMVDLPVRRSAISQRRRLGARREHRRRAA